MIKANAAGARYSGTVIKQDNSEVKKTNETNTSQQKASTSSTLDPKLREGAKSEAIARDRLAKKKLMATFPLSKKEMDNAVESRAKIQTSRYSSKIFSRPQTSRSLDYLDLASQKTFFSDLKSNELTNFGKVEITAAMILDLFNKVGNSNAGYDDFLVLDTDDKTLTTLSWEVEGGKPTPKIKIISRSDEKSGNKIEQYEGVFGNIDVFVVSKDADKNCSFCKGDIEKIEPHVLVKVQSSLKDGYMINADTLSNHTSILDMSKVKGKTPIDRINIKHMAIMKKAIESSPGGHLILRGVQPSKPLLTLHQTGHLGSIVKGKEINSSKAGCLGSGIYTTYVPYDKEGPVVSGHTIGMFKRSLHDRSDVDLKKMEAEHKVPSAVPGAEFILFESEYDNTNNTTNWLEFFGKGRLYLEALSSMKAEGKGDQKEIRKSEEATVKSFEDLFPLLQKSSGLNESWLNGKANVNDFDSLWKNVEKSREKQPEIMNNIVFESLKDYIMLHKVDESHPGIDMSSQYSIIFSLSEPDMRQSWDIKKLNTDMDKMVEVLSQSIPDFDEDSFKLFMFDSLMFTLNGRLMEGDAPSAAKTFSSFDGLAQQHPNVSGFLFHIINAKEHKGAPNFDEYLSVLRDVEKDARTNNNISISNKSFLFGTEEWSLTPEAKGTSTYKASFSHDDGQLLVNKEEPLNLNIAQRPSSTAGFTKR